MKILLDVNVVVDILGATEDFLYSYQALDIMMLRGFRPCLLVSEVPVAQCILMAQKLAGEEKSLDALKELLDLCEPLDVTPADLREALKEPLGDFEDALLAWAAKRHDVDLILTRNLRDFKGSPVAVMDPQQFCETYRPDGYKYDLVEL